MTDLKLFFTGILLSEGYPIENVLKVLQHHFGTLIQPSQPYKFNVTDYYTPEMGAGLTRYFVAFELLQEAFILPEMKQETIEIEHKHFTKGGNRIVNLDPGYLDSVKIVLASTKPGGHKIALSPTIYADMVLDYYKGQFRSFDWSFPDFKMGLYDNYFQMLRQTHRELANRVDVSK